MQLMFLYPLKYRQHINGRRHKLFGVKSLAIHPSTSTPNANEEVELPDSETSEDMYGTATRDSDIENEAEGMTNLEDLFEEMNDKAGQSNGSYFPFPSKIFALLYLLVSSPHPMHGMIVNVILLLLIVSGNSPREKRIFYLCCNTLEFKHQVYLLLSYLADRFP